MITAPVMRPLTAQVATRRLGESHSLPAVVSFDPRQLFTNGEVGWWHDPATRELLFTDFAGTTPVVAEGDAVALIADRTSNGLAGKKATTSARPLMKYLPLPHRPYLDFDGVDDVLTVAAPSMGSNCTVIRFLAASVSIISGQTISGNFNNTLDNFGMVVINRALTTDEIAQVTLFGQQRAGNADQYNVQYGADATNELLDVYHSSGHPRRPIIVMVHGGGWRNGDKQLSNVTMNKLLKWLPLGFTFVSVNYKLDVGTDPHDQAISVAKAFAYVQANAASWGCDPRNIVWWGHSAGAHLVALAQCDDAIRNGAGIKPWLGTLLLDTAAYDVNAIMLNPSHPSLYDEPFSGGATQWTADSPVHVVTSKLPPMMLVISSDPTSGEGDEVNGDAFIATVNALGTTTTKYITPLGHGEMNDLLGTLDPGDPNYTPAVVSWLATLGL